MAIAAGLTCLATGCGSAIEEMLSEIWNDGDGIPDGGFGGYDQTDENLAADLACKVIAEAVDLVSD